MFQPLQGPSPGLLLALPEKDIFREVRRRVEKIKHQQISNTFQSRVQEDNWCVLLPWMDQVPM